MPAQRHLSLLALALIASGCGEAEPDAGAAADWTGISTDTLVVETVIGSLDSDGPDAFGQIAGVVSDAQGRIYVADSQAGAVQVFDTSGTFVFSVGTAGEGPGELRSPCCLGWGPEGNLWVRDRGNARFSLFEVGEAGAGFVTTVRMPHGDPRRPSPTTFQDSLLVDVANVRTESGARALGRYLVTRSGEVAEFRELPPIDPEMLGGTTVTSADGAIRSFYYPPMGPTDLRDFGPGGRMVTGVSSEYDLVVTSPAGSTTVRGSVTEGPPLSADDVERIEARLRAIANEIGSSVGRLPFGVPDRKPPIRDAWFSPSGDLWVELSVEQGAMRIAEIWSDDGRPKARVAWPADVALGSMAWVGDDRVVGTRRDDLGVDYVVVMDRPE